MSESADQSVDGTSGSEDVLELWEAIAGGCCVQQIVGRKDRHKLGDAVLTSDLLHFVRESIPSVQFHLFCGVLNFANSMPKNQPKGRFPPAVALP